MKVFDGFWFKNFKRSHVFKSVKEVNEFVLEYAQNKVTYAWKHSGYNAFKGWPSSDPVY